MKKLVLILSLLIAACGSPYNTPTTLTSQLVGNWNYGSSQITFIGNKFSYQQCNTPGFKFPETATNLCTSGCAQTGVYQDLDTGSQTGQVSFAYQFDTCETPSKYSEVKTYYIINGQLVLN